MSFESKTSCKSTSPSIYYAIRINTIKIDKRCKSMQVLHDFEEWHLRYSFIQFSCFPCPSAKLPSLCRLDLEAGTFLMPLEMQKLTEINEVVTILALRPFSKALLRSLPFAFCHGSEGQYLYVPRCSKHFLALRNPRLPILTCCGDGGIVESYDLRDPSPLQLLKALSFLSQDFVWTAMDG